MAVEPRGGAGAHSVMAEGASEGLCAGLAVAWSSVRKGGANTFWTRGCRQCLMERSSLDERRVFSTRLYRIGIPISEGFYACLEQTWNCSHGLPAWLTDRQRVQEEEGFSCTEVSGIHLVSAEHLGLVGFTLNGPQNITKKKKKCQCCKNQVQTQINNSFTDGAEAQNLSLINSYPSWAAKETF